MLGVEDRDGVQLLRRAGLGLRPVELVRTPGLGRDRTPPGHLRRRLRLPSSVARGSACACALNSRQPRVLAIWSAVSQARRAVATA